MIIKLSTKSKRVTVLQGGMCQKNIEVRRKGGGDKSVQGSIQRKVGFNSKHQDTPLPPHKLSRREEIHRLS